MREGSRLTGGYIYQDVFHYANIIIHWDSPVVGLDSSADMVDFAHRQFAAEGVHNLFFQHGDATAPGFTEEFYMADESGAFHVAMVRLEVEATRM